MWEDARSGVDNDIWGARLDNNGNVLGDGFIIGSGAGSQYAPALAFDGANHLVVWADTRNASTDIYGTFVDTLGNVSNPLGLAIETSASEQRAPALAYQSSKYLVAWQDNTSGWSIRGAHVTTGGVVNASVALANTTSDETAPAVAYNGTDYLVVWQLGPSLAYDLRAARFNNNLSAHASASPARSSIRTSRSRTPPTKKAPRRWRRAPRPRSSSRTPATTRRAR